VANLKIEGITKQFGNKKILDNITLEVDSGSFVCLLGPPGAGKTTLLKVIAGLIVPDTGKIRLGDKDITNLPTEQRDVALVFQSFALYPHMTVYDNIASPLKAKKLSKDAIDKKVKQIAQFLRIQKLLERKPGLLSGGEKQRVAIGRSLAKEPEIFLFDEPLTNLDYKLREEMRGEFKEMLEKLGKTIVYATPDPVDALSMAVKIAVMDNGKILQYGFVDEIYEHPSNLTVGTLVGYPEMNALDCSLVEKDGRLFLDTGSFTVDVTTFKNKLEGRGPQVILGLRPEHLSISGEPSKKSVSLEGKVYVAEIIGAETILHVEVKKDLVKVFIPHVHKATLGEDVRISFDLDNIHVFDKDTEKSII